MELKDRPALLVIDMQNGFVHPSGTFGKLGMDVQNHQTVIPAIAGLVALFRSRHLPVLFTTLAWEEDYSDCGRLLDKLSVVKDVHGFVKGTWDAEIVDELKPQDSDVVISKTRNSAFWNTGLEEKLQDMGVNQVIVAGVGTNVCVESTVRDAFTIGFYTVVVPDATATLTAEAHRASLESMQWFGDQAVVQDIEKALAGRDVAAAQT